LKSAVRAAGLWVPVVAYGGLVFYLSSLSVPPVAGRLPDYIVHPLEYLGLTFLVVRAINGGLVAPISAATHLSAIAFTVAYAVSDEIHQLHVPRRTASLKDVLSDTLGAVLAVGAAEMFQRVYGRRLTAPLRITLYTRSGCALCHDARETLLRLEREIALVLDEVDVDTDPSLASRYGDQVPVILVGETLISTGTPDEAALRRRLLRRAPRSA